MTMFFSIPNGKVIVVKSVSALNKQDIDKLCWLFGGAKQIYSDKLRGKFIGPRREMVTPWSTNAVEMAQNMGIVGVERIEEFISEPCDYDPMLQRRYDSLSEDIFDVHRKPEPIKYIDNLEEYNEEEGLALSSQECAYLHNIEAQIERRLTDSEVFGFAQINSEHCRHKIFNGTFVIDGKEKSQSLFNLIRQTTKENPGRIVSAYKDNVAFALGPEIEIFAPNDHTTSDWFSTRKIKSVLSLKAETHNFPTTVEPFNGAATGTGGEIRDRMAGGVGSWPIAGTAVYITSYPLRQNIPSAPKERKWLYQTPEQILIKASNGASDFGNKFGQPLICGSLLTFEYQQDEKSPIYAYDKVIMLAGGVGYGNARDYQKREPKTGDLVVVLGGDNYRIGLGGGSVSSVDTGRYSSGIELNAVQRANPEMQKRAYNLIRALCEQENNPVVSIHDHGSAGHLNCLSELVGDCGGTIDMTKLPIGDNTLSAKEIISNESQERMGLLIDKQSIDKVKQIAERERAPIYIVGQTTGDAHFSFVQKDGLKPFDLDTAQMFGHSPKTVMVDSYVLHNYPDVHYTPTEDTPTFHSMLDEYVKNVLKLEAVACKDWLTNKVDRSVTGRVARQQCVGKLQLPLSDCAVVSLDFTGKHGIATSLGHAPQAALASEEKGSILSVAEALTNIVWAPLTYGLDGVSLSANWMWPCRSQKGEDARLYGAVEALSNFCRELRINVPTGKDSLSMTQQYQDGSKVIAPGTVIVSAMAETENVELTVSPVLILDARASIYHIDFSFDDWRLGGSAFAQSLGEVGKNPPTVVQAEYFRICFETIQELIKRGWIMSGHDISAGGLITTLLEMCFANDSGGMNINLHDICRDGDMIKTLFAENTGVVVEIGEKHNREFKKLLEERGIGYAKIGYPVVEQRNLTIKSGDISHVFDIDIMRKEWYETSYRLDSKQSMNGCALQRRNNYMLQPLEISFTSKCIAPQISQRSNQKPRAAIIREKGTNGEREMAYALHLAGFAVKDVMMTDLTSGRESLDEINMIVFCGGFSNSDVLGSAKGWAGAFLYNPMAKEALDRYYAREDTLSLGICNGCQLMVALGLVQKRGTKVSMEQNISHKFESAYLSLYIPSNNSVMLSNLSGSKLGVWVAHGEGRFSLPEGEEEYNIVAKYNYHDYPGNPNGSDGDTAAICSFDGRHLAMMPHPERAILSWQNPWKPNCQKDSIVTPWLQAFMNARKWIEKKMMREEMA